MAEKQAIINLHWDMETYEEADFYRLNEILSAKEVKDRVSDPLALARSAGLQI